MNESINVVFGNRLGNTFCPFDMNILESKVPKTMVQKGLAHKNNDRQTWWGSSVQLSYRQHQNVVRSPR
jgi:hypothetical protein